MTPLDFAKAYLSWGWSLIPIVPETKEPAVKWLEFTERQPTIEEVSSWIDLGLYLAVVTGDISGICIVDDDRIKNGLSEWGFQSPVVAKTQSGGKHYYFRYDREIHSHSNTSLHVDLKGWHSYCLVPPFKDREWVSKPSENLEKLTPIPDEIVRLINSDKENRDLKQEPLRIADFIDIPIGARTESLHRIACSIFSKTNFDDGLRILKGVNDTYNPPLSQKEFDYQTTRAWQYIQTGKKPELIPPTQEEIIIKTGFKLLDNILGGFHSGGAYIIGGEEKSGKTSLVLNFVKNFVDAGNKVFYASTELSQKEIQNYMDSIAGEKWVNSNLHFYDMGEKGTLKEHLETIEEELGTGTRIVVIDNLTSYRDHSDLHKDEWMRIAQAGDSYRRLGKKWEAVVLMVLHLNQNTRLNEIPKSVKKLIEKQEQEKIFSESVSCYRRPTKDDLKGGAGMRSQTKGQLLLWRPYQGFFKNDLNKLSCLIVENNRHGATGDVRMNFDGVTKKFIETEPIDISYEKIVQTLTPLAYKDDEVISGEQMSYE